MGGFRVIDEKGNDVTPVVRDIYRRPGMSYDPPAMMLKWLILLLVIVSLCGSIFLPFAHGFGATWAQAPDAFTPSDEPSKCKTVLATIGFAGVVLATRNQKQRDMIKQLKSPSRPMRRITDAGETFREFTDVEVVKDENGKAKTMNKVTGEEIVDDRRPQVEEMPKEEKKGK